MGFFVLFIIVPWLLMIAPVIGFLLSSNFILGSIFLITMFSLFLAFLPKLNIGLLQKHLQESILPFSLSYDDVLILLTEKVGGQKKLKDLNVYITKSSVLNTPMTIYPSWFGPEVYIIKNFNDLARRSKASRIRSIFTQFVYLSSQLIYLKIQRVSKRRGGFWRTLLNLFLVLMFIFFKPPPSWGYETNK